MPTAKKVSAKPCPGYDSSGPYLDDVTRQADEEYHARLEGRKPVILKKECRFKAQDPCSFCGYSSASV